MVHKSVIRTVILLLLSFASDGFAAYFLPPLPAEVEKGSHADFICESENKQPIIECRFTVPGFETKILIFSGITKNEKYEFVGDGFSKGQCGLRLRSVNKLNAGKVECSLVLGDLTQEESETNVTVLYPIEKLNVSNLKDAGDYEYKENNTMDFTCSAEGGFPAPTLSLFLGGQILNSTPQKNCSWRGQAKYIYNKQQLLCIAEQTSSSGWKKTKNSTRQQVFVKYAPRLPIESDEPVMWVSVYSSNEVNVTVEILANPDPYAFELSKNGIILDVQPRFNATANGVFEYTWTMLAVQQADFISVWNLNVSNDIGNINVAVKLRQLTTTSTRPPDNGLGDGDILMQALFYAFILFLLLVLLAGCICASKKKLPCFKDTTRKQSEEAKMTCALPLEHINHQNADVNKSPEHTALLHQSFNSCAV